MNGKEQRYIMAIVVIFLVAMFGQMILDSLQKNQCIQTAIQAGKSASEIREICR